MIGTIGHESEPKEKARKDRGGGSAPVSPIYRSPVSTGEYLLRDESRNRWLTPLSRLTLARSHLPFSFFPFSSPLFQSSTIPFTSFSPPPKLFPRASFRFFSTRRRVTTINYETTNRTVPPRSSILRWKGEASMIPYNADAIRPQTLPTSPRSSFDPLCFENFPSVRPFQEFHLEKYSSIVIASGGSRDPEPASRLLFSRTVNNRSR